MDHVIYCYPVANTVASEGIASSHFSLQGRGSLITACAEPGVAVASGNLRRASYDLSCGRFSRLRDSCNKRTDDLHHAQIALPCCSLLP
jgi:hypothetical protein